MRLANADILHLVPEFMRSDEAVIGLATAVNKLIREPGQKVKALRVWDQIDELDIDWYSSSLPLENKRAVVKISDLVHRRRGTKWAVEELVSAYITPGFVMEWHEEGYVNPRPFHFTVYTTSRNVTDSMLKEFSAIAKVAMSARSRMDGVYFSDTYGSEVATGHTVDTYFFTSKKCGTIPHLAVVGSGISDGVAVVANASGTGNVTLAKCGTTKCGN